MEPTTFGFVGVGRMGALMSARLLEAGHKVCVFDVSREAVEAVKQKGAQALGSAAEVANNAEVVFLSLPNPEIVREACMGPGGVLEGKLLNADEVKSLAKSKSKPELIGDVLGMAKGPGARVAAAESHSIAQTVPDTGKAVRSSSKTTLMRCLQLTFRV